MKTKLKILGVLVGVIGVIALRLLYMFFLPEHYKILYNEYIVTTNANAIITPNGIYKSNADLIKSCTNVEILARIKNHAFNLDDPKLMACVVSNRSVAYITRWDWWSYGRVYLRKNLTNGTSIVVFQGPKELEYWFFGLVESTQTNRVLWHRKD